ncbi:RNase H domain-containing protein [Aphis craccivora]|uniref:RNase H domain-containing protein n=1 Tax=Aphis craccivora TaxID=307492 RepID=A0A6G0YEQ1_APHCR|nr:RNase H domain-containing protein [Aphis craccivora]
MKPGSNLNLSRSSIVHFNRLRSGYTFLPAHANKLDLNNSPLCTLHISESPCDLFHILFDCPSLLLKRTFNNKSARLAYFMSIDIDPLIKRFSPLLEIEFPWSRRPQTTVTKNMKHI